MIEMKIVAKDGGDLYAQLMQLSNTLLWAAADRPVQHNTGDTQAEVPATESPKALGLTVLPDTSGTEVASSPSTEQKKRTRQPKAALPVSDVSPATASPPLSELSSGTAPNATESSKHPIDGLDDGAAQQVVRDKLTEVLRVLGPEPTFAALMECTGVKKISEVKPEQYKALYDHLHSKQKEAA